MSSSPLCSIIIPTYNHGKYIERSITSALSQTLKNIEIVVVDDGSTDNTEKIVEQFRDKITYHRKQNGGAGHSRNKGIELSTGKYLQFIDADDTIEETKLEKQAAILENDSSLALVYSDCRFTEPDGVKLENISYPLSEDEDPIPILIEKTLSNLDACLIRRSAIMDVGMFDESRIAQEDWDLWLRLALKGYKFKYVPGDLAHYDQRGSSIIVNSELMYKRTQHMLRKYLDDPDFRNLGQSTINEFVAYQSISLATRAFNNRWWKQSRHYFMKTAFAAPKMMDAAFWACVPKTIVYQLIDKIKGTRVAEPDYID